MLRNLALLALTVTALGACTKTEPPAAQATETAALPTATATDAAAGGPVVYRNAEGLAIGGYDPVSYFSGAPSAGDPAFVSTIDGATFRFASAANKAAFDADPSAYLPQYGGYCAYGASQGAKFPTIPETGTVVGGKLYFNKNLDVQKLWNKDQTGLIEKADALWPSIKEDAPRG